MLRFINQYANKSDMVDIKENRTQIAIVVIGYNRLDALKRSLTNLSKCQYSGRIVPLVISIDASGNQQVYEYVRNFEWIHGQKYVNIEKERLGLKNHIFQCGNLSQYFRAVILLEDDIFVAPFFYDYACAAVERYENEKQIAGISMYAPEMNDHINLPFQPENNGFDVYAWQRVSSWGQIWTRGMWSGFKKWYDNWDANFDLIDMPRRIKGWTRAWSKFYYAYLIENDKYYIYPLAPLATNFNDAGGEHGGGNGSLSQVSLLTGRRNYQLGDFDDLVKYDAYFTNLRIPHWLGINPDEMIIDFYGLKENYNRRYILAPFELPYKRVRGFSLSMRPWELNIKYNIEGNDIFLYERELLNEKTVPERKFDITVVSYYLRGFNIQLLRNYIFDGFKKGIKRRLHI